MMSTYNYYFLFLVFMTVLVLTSQITSYCNEDYFQCRTLKTKCLRDSERCNGHRGCSDGSDEMFCGKVLV